MLNDPQLLIVDEPTTGLDPTERVRFRTLLAGLAADRLTILPTHIIGDVAAVATRLILLRAGRLLADTTPEELLRTAQRRAWTVYTDRPTALRLQSEHPVSGLRRDAHGVQLRVLSAARPHSSAVPAEPTVEDAYLLAVGGKTASTAVDPQAPPA